MVIKNKLIQDVLYEYEFILYWDTSLKFIQNITLNVNKIFFIDMSMHANFSPSRAGSSKHLQIIKKFGVPFVM